MKTSQGKKLIEKKKKESASKKITEQRELIELQRGFKHAVMIRLYKGLEMMEMDRQLNIGEITMQWYGIPFPPNLLRVEHDLTRMAYKELVAEENYKRQALENRGFKAEHIKKVIEGHTYKEVPKK